MAARSDVGTANDSPGKALSITPTWVVALVMAVFVLMSLLVERSIHTMSCWLLKTKRKPLWQSLEKMKEELMLLGFISLFMSFVASFFTGICINSSFYDRQFTSCKHSTDGSASFRRLGYEHLCAKGKEPLISVGDIHEIHRLLFVMAVTHIFYSCMTVALALTKVYSWSCWEQEAHSDAYDSYVEITRETPLKRQFVFALYHTSKPWSLSRFLVWMTCFARQFGQSVNRVDYLTIRSGFIAVNNLGPDYNFHHYVKRSMEDDFTKIVGISVPLWGFAILFSLLNVQGFNLYFWIAFLPMIVVVAVGTKLQHVIATVTVEKLLVKAVGGASKGGFSYNKLFWFGRPEYLLWFLHFTLFQNAFELATYLWSLWDIPDHSCLMRSKIFVYIRLAFGLVVQVLCSYSTLPMYALVTKIGSSFKKAMISERVRELLHKWHMDARKRVNQASRHGAHRAQSSTGTVYGQRKEVSQQSSPP